MLIGEKVFSSRTADVGTVTTVHDCFDAPSMEFVSMTSSEWLSQQTPPFTEAELSEKWLTVECDSGGSIMGPESSFVRAD